MELVGCSPEQLISHLGADKWDVRKEADYHIDHIWPCEMYDLEDDDEQLKCFNWQNLQLLGGSENSQKGHRPPSPSIGELVPTELRPRGWHY